MRLQNRSRVSSLRATKFLTLCFSLSLYILRARTHALYGFFAVAIAARFAYDVIALVLFGVDENSINATAERPCHSFDAMQNKSTALENLLGKPWTT